MKFGIRIDTPEDARRWVEVYVDGEPPEREGIDGQRLISAGSIGPDTPLGQTPAQASCVSFNAAVDKVACAQGQGGQAKNTGARGTE